MGIFDKLAETAGRALGTFQHARDTARRPSRPSFFTSMAQQHNWTGGWRWDGNDQERQERAVQNSWVYTAISKIAREASAAEFQIVEHSGPDDEPVQVQNHPLERLLRRPNPYMGGAFLWQYSYWWLKLDGNFYWFVLPDHRGQPAELWPLPASAVTPVFGDGERILDYYEYNVGGRLYQIPAEYVVHVRQPNPFNAFVGISELVAAMLPVDNDLAMTRWNGAFFGKNNTMPSAIINLSSGDPNAPINPADANRLRADLEDDYAAFERKTLVTTANSVNATLLGWNPHDMDFGNGRQFNKEEILTIYGVPLGVVDANATEANATVANEAFLGNTIWPLLVLVAEQLTAELVIPYYCWWTHAPQMEAQFADVRPVNREMELRERETARGVMTIDEVRARYYALDPLPDGRGLLLEGEVQAQVEPQFGPDFGLPWALPAQSAPIVEEAVTSELGKYERKSLAALKRGQSADVDFETNILPAEMVGHLRLHLQTAQTHEQVRAAFQEVAADAHFFRSNIRLVKRPFRPWSLFENRLNDVVNAFLTAQAQRIVERIQRDGERFDDDLLWTDEQRRLEDALRPEIEALALFGVQKVREALGEQAVGINWDLANSRAAEWARQYAGERSKTLTETTRTSVREQLGQWIENAETLPDLIQRVSTVVDNPVRAEMIAITEATNSYAEANAQAWGEAGYSPAIYRPAAHVRCRCYLQPYKLPDGARVMVWYTARDERVCTQPLTVPWQGDPVQGCRALHTVVVSKGDYTGMKLSAAIAQAKQQQRA